MGKNWLGVCGTLEYKWSRVHNGTKGVIPSHKAEHETEQELEDKEDPEKDQEGDQEEEQVEDQEESKEENDGEDEEDGDNEEGDEEDDVDHEEDVEDDGPEPWELIFLRAINPTNKLGGATNENLTTDGFKLQTGSIYVQSPVSVQFERHRVLLDQNGAVGPAHRRRLQSLGIGWGMPKQAFVVHESNMHEINEEELGQGFGNAISYEWYPLPLYRLKRAYSSEEAQSKTDFFDGEIIRLVEWSRNSDEYEILDCESNSSRVSLKHLETSGVSSLVKGQKLPYGFHLLEDIPATVLGTVQEEGQEILRVSTKSSDSTSEADNVEEREAIFASEGSFNSEGQCEESDEGAVSAQPPKANAIKHRLDDDVENGPREKNKRLRSIDRQMKIKEGKNLGGLSPSILQFYEF